MSRKKSVGTCTFCHKSFSKGGMTRHLAACEARRLAQLEATAPGHTWRLGRVFRLLVESKRHPAYWMHIEVPADAPLSELDTFLRETWVECCDHLSAFTIGDVMYNSEEETEFYPDSMLDFEGEFDDDFDEDYEDDFDDEDEDDEADEALDANASQDEQTAILSNISEVMRLMGVQDEGIAQFQTDMLDLAKEHTGTETTPENTQSMIEKMLGHFSRATGISEDMLRMAAGQVDPSANPLDVWGMYDDDFDEQGMDVPMGDVLRPRLDFEYDYDFGSTTTLTLRVVEEYSGQIEQDMGVRILARNEQPEVMCGACGNKLATMICTECDPDQDSAWLCDDCAAAHEHDEDVFLPVLNSPRAGMCSYGADELYFEDDDEDSNAPGAAS